MEGLSPNAAHAIATQVDPRAVLEAAVKLVREQFHDCVVFAALPDDGLYRITSADGTTDPRFEDMRPGPGRGLGGYVLEQGHAVRVEDYEQDPRITRHFAADPRCRAVGETGLDYFRDYAARDAQDRAFVAQIRIAQAVDKPLVIHTRAADDATINTLERYADGVTVILHCFSMPDRLDDALDNGWYVSYAGNVTYPKSQALAATAVRAPLDRILVETDAPYLTPQPVRKERNQPANVVLTAEFIAEHRGIPYEELEAAVEANAAKLFGW